jgi:Domain of unknown function (DUF4303)
MLDIDYRAARAVTRDAARRAFTRVRDEHPGERFYAFALCTDLDVQSLCASANTEEGFRWRLERNEKSRKQTEAAIAKHGMTWADYTNYFRWNLPEWAYHQIEGGDFRALDPLILDPVHMRANELEEEDPEGFDDHRTRVCGSMILAMKDLDEEGLFGAGEERRAVVLLCDLVEPPEKYWFAVESARRLNPPEVFDGFLKQWLAWLSPNDRAPIEDPAAYSPIYRPLRAFLDGEA